MSGGRPVGPCVPRRPIQTSSARRRPVGTSKGGSTPVRPRPSRTARGDVWRTRSPGRLAVHCVARRPTECGSPPSTSWGLRAGSSSVLTSNRYHPCGTRNGARRAVDVMTSWVHLLSLSRASGLGVHRWGARAGRWGPRPRPSDVWVEPCRWRCPGGVRGARGRSGLVCSVEPSLVPPLPLVS